MKWMIFVFLGLVSLPAFSESSASSGLPTYLQSYPKSAYSTLTSGSESVGKTENLWRMNPSGELVFSENTELKLKLYQNQETVATKTIVTTNADLSVKAIDFDFKATGGSASVKALRKGDQLELSVSQGGKIQKNSMMVKDPALTGPTVIPFLLKRGLPTQKETLNANLIELSAYSVIPVKIEIAPKAEKSQWEIEMTYLNHSTKRIIDKTGSMIREETDFAGLPVVGLPSKGADFKNQKLTGTKEDLVERARVQFPAFAEARTASRFSVKLDGIDVSEFDLTRHRQKLDKNSLVIEREVLPKKTKTISEIAGESSLKVYLQEEPQIPVKDPLIQKKAAEVVGKESDLWKRALLVQQFVYDHLEKVPTISVPNAVEVLKSGKGDCNEHSALYTALARAAGVPTRTVVGLVYSDRFYGNNGFYYHAWVEVYAGYDWVALDPTWNQVPADVTHIAFVEGGLDKQIKITGLMGKIKLTQSTL